MGFATKCTLALGSMVVALSAAVSGPAAALSVALDIGHSRQKPGAVSARGVNEFEFNRALAQTIAEVLRQRGVRVTLIGADGDMNDLYARTHLAAGADFFLSIHHDSVQPQYLQSWTVDGAPRHYSDRFSGFSLFVSRQNPYFAQSLSCAALLGAQLRAAGFQPSAHHAEPIPGENRSFVDWENGVYAFDNLVVLRTASQPAALLEAGIIVNRADEQTLRQPATRARIATAVADGLERCLARPSAATP